jgi:hypothetical protein
MEERRQERLKSGRGPIKKSWTVAAIRAEFYSDFPFPRAVAADVAWAKVRNPSKRAVS